MKIAYFSIIYMIILTSLISVISDVTVKKLKFYNKFLTT